VPEATTTPAAGAKAAGLSRMRNPQCSLLRNFNQDAQFEQAHTHPDAEHRTSLETALGDGQPVAATRNGAGAAPLRLIGDQRRRPLGPYTQGVAGSSPAPPIRWLSQIAAAERGPRPRMAAKWLR
jgi:hypothetical protein